MTTSKDTLTYKDLVEIGKSIERDPYTFSGIKIYEVPETKSIPKIQVDKDFKYCSTEFRNKLNIYLMNMFGFQKKEKQSMLMYHTAIFATKQDIAILNNIS